MLLFQLRKESQSCYAGSFLTSPIQLNHMFPADIASIELQYIGRANSGHREETLD